MYIDGNDAGSGEGDGEEPGNIEGQTPDDEDNTEAHGELGSGTEMPTVQKTGEQITHGS